MKGSQERLEQPLPKSTQSSTKNNKPGFVANKFNDMKLDDDLVNLSQEFKVEVSRDKAIKPAIEKTKAVAKPMRGSSPKSEEMEQVITLIKESFSKGIEPTTIPEFYRAGRMLGKGAFGKVSLAMHKITRKLTAIKAINKEYLSEEK